MEDRPSYEDTTSLLLRTDGALLQHAEEDSAAAKRHTDPTAGNMRKSPPDRPPAEKLIPLHLISRQALLELLVEKGYLTHRELSEKELAVMQAGRPEWSQADSAVPEGPMHLVQTRSRREHAAPRFRWLRKVMSRHRWTRKLGSMIFGWKWRRVKHDAAGSHEAE